MNYKKLLLTISLVIILIFVLMMFTSYAWYTFSIESTAFDLNTYNEYIDINYQTSQHINVNNAIPIDDDMASTEASSNNFIVTVNNPDTVAEVLLSISLVNINIDNELKNAFFKYQLLHDGEIIKEGTGLDFTDSTFELTSKEVIYSSNSNSFIFRVWISENGLDQTEMENKTFQASIEVNAVKIRNIDNYCIQQGFNKLSDCMLVIENRSATVNDAKTYISNKGTPDFSKTAPIINYEEIQASISSSSVISTSDRFTLGSSYTFNEDTGMFVLQNYTNNALTDDYLNYYTCGSTTGSWNTCTTMYKILSYTTSTSSSGVVTYKVTSAIKYTTKSTSALNSDLGLYKATDDLGDSYYYRGAVRNNYVLFAGFYWRIIRRIGDGSIRMIYSGTSAEATGSATSIGTSAFNTKDYDPTYVGYMYNEDFALNESNTTNVNYTNFAENTTYYFGSSYVFDSTNHTFSLNGNLTSGKYKDIYGSDSTAFTNYPYTCFSTSSTGTCNYIVKLKTYVNAYTVTENIISYSSRGYAVTLENTTNSTIKEKVDMWYETNILNKFDENGNSYSSYLSDSIFCNDRTVNTGSGYLMVPTTTYGAYGRLVSQKSPTLVCGQTTDKFSVSSSIGNGRLTYPVGLITVDEASFAGGVSLSQNNLYYLHTGQTYWTASAHQFNASSARVSGWHVNSTGFLEFNCVSRSYGVRPVINLSSDVLIESGDGTYVHPYVVQEE